MADLFERASDWLQDQRTKHLSQTVVYRRGTDEVELAATIGRTVFEVDDGLGLIERTESRDFLVLAKDLILGGTTALPQRGDQIVETQGTMTFIYEVMAPGKEPHWRYSDPYRRSLRIHTKHVATEAP